MANRFLSSDQTKWFGPTHIGPAPAGRTDNGAKRISKFIFEGPEGSPIAKLRSSYETAIGAVTGLRKKRDETESTGQYTSLGISEQLAKSAVTDEIPALKRARAAVDKIKGEIAEKRSGLKLTKPTDEQQRELAEIRSAMRGMSTEQRETFVKQNRSDPTVAAAIAHAIPALSGVDPLVRQHIAEEQLKREHGDVLGELADLEEVVSVVDKVTSVARAELREIMGTTPEIFEQVAKVGEHRDGEMPFKVETRVIEGRAVDVCRVYDMAAKEWRDASNEEISGRAA
ncbi:hypothetical protein [Bradyrhizobium sp. Mp64]|uniref:hypothetical protein n=1 Tax=Bradyrhizobium sp. Mp64 TaxID=3042158 RepID=UPI00248D3714|nr:hypothetical protein [Bradyrhizobium sp. Mp64]MDI2103936.1 hypothetical protein [Bradyrhizobium sp. Mp64]